VNTASRNTEMQVHARNHAVVLGGSLSQDYRYRETEGGALTLKNRFMHRYMDQILKLATFDTSVRYVLLQAFGMLVPPTALFGPGIVSRVVRQAIIGQHPKSETRRTSRSQMIYDTGGD
jgi:hypothetical protein